jgi:stage II sporulation protein D
VRSRTPVAVLALVLLSVAGGSVLPSRIQPHAAASTLPRVSFVAAPGSSILVHGSYPKVTSSCVDTVQPILHSRFDGTIEVGMDSAGKLFVIGVLPFEDYLKGIAEVPRTWPVEALKAQVVAARSYALANLAYPDATGEALGYDICATDSCQVYRGMGISNGPYGDRWVAAVDDTAGQALLYQGRPADTLYFSTSKGSTVGNDVVFGTDPLPYLRPVKEKDDGASPVRHWHVEIPFDDLAKFLSAAGAWGGGAITKVTLSGSDVTIDGGGASETMSVTDFRIHLNYWAHCLEPTHYPGINTNGISLPQTIPSKWFDLSSNGSSVTLDGAGWGHGVGMTQWGAEGKAARGLSYQDILAYYYGGLLPTEYAGEPATIRVGIAVGLNAVKVEGTGTVTVDGSTISEGPWLITGGKVLRVRHTSPPQTYIPAASLAKAPARATSGGTLSATVSVLKLSVVSLLLRSPDGIDYPVGDPLTAAAGQITLSGEVPQMPSGTYSLVAVATDGIDIVDSKPQPVDVLGYGPGISPSPSVSPPSGTPVTPAPSSGSSLPLFVGLAGAAAVVVIGIALIAARRRRRKGRRSAWQETGPGP